MSPIPALRISEQRLLERIEQARRTMADHGAKLAVIYAPPRISSGGGGVLHYLLGWAPISSASLLVLPVDGPPLVLSAGPNATRVFNQRLLGFGSARAYAGMHGLAKMLSATLGEFSATGTIATFGASDMPSPLRAALDDAFPDQVAIDKPLNDLRLVRHSDEVALHRRGAEISCEMIERVMELAASGSATPADLMIEAEYTGRKGGADFASTWLATGEKPPTTYFELFELNSTLGPRDRIQMGTNLAVEGHYAQCLRTGVRSKPDQALLDCTDMLLEMQDAALAALVPGQPLHRVGDVLEAMIDRYCPYERAADPFRFQSCHALGINYVEPCCATALDPNRDRAGDADGPLVAENMVIEIHPNFTLPDLGHVCAGDMALVTATGAQWITEYPRGLVRLD